MELIRGGLQAESAAIMLTVANSPTVAEYKEATKKITMPNSPKDEDRVPWMLASFVRFDAAKTAEPPKISRLGGISQAK